MSLTFAIAIYFICWWIALFIVLPIGVRTQEEMGSVEPGTPSSAPAAPALKKRMIATTLLAAVLFAAVYAILVLELIALDDIPFLPSFEGHAGTG